MRYPLLSICGVFALLVTSTALWAHHSPSAIFDMKHPASLKGTVSKVDWVNPHIVLYMDLKVEDGKTEAWKFESNPPKWFSQVGVNRADFAAAVGKEVTVLCVKAVDGTKYGYLLEITFPGGNLISLRSDDSEK